MARALPFQFASQVRRFDMRDELNRQFLKNERFLLRSPLFRPVAMEEKKWSSPLPALENSTRLDKGEVHHDESSEKNCFCLVREFGSDLQRFGSECGLLAGETQTG